MTRIMGRVRNMLTLADGSKVYPRLTGSGLDDIAALRRFQLLQHDIDDFELRVVLRQTLNDDVRTALQSAIDAAIGRPVEVRITVVDDIPRDPSGKFEDVKSSITA